METKEVKGTTAQGANTDKNNAKTATTNMRPNVTGKDAKNETDKGKADAKTPQASAAQTPAPAASNTPANQQPANAPKSAEAPKVAQEVKAAPQAEPSKKELKEQLNSSVRGLEDTVKLVEVLGKKIAQKNKLSNTITNLDTFLFAQNDDKDDAASDSKFGRCELVIADDGGEEFVTKNPFIISKVVDMVKQLCLDKLAEVEATIVIPQ